jgi:gamma-polyglutamate biosynthesis protein CapC
MIALTLSIGLGLIFTLIFVPLLGLYPGGMIAPGYLALQLNQPKIFLATLAIAILIHYIVVMLSNFCIIYGQRKIALSLILSYLLCSLIQHLINPYLANNLFGDIYIGYIIPGLIALSISRQGLIETIGSLLILSVFVRLILIILLGNTIL